MHTKNAVIKRTAMFLFSILMLICFFSLYVSADDNENYDDSPAEESISENNSEDDASDVYTDNEDTQEEDTDSDVDNNSEVDKDTLPDKNSELDKDTPLPSENCDVETDNDNDVTEPEDSESGEAEEIKNDEEIQPTEEYEHLDENVSETPSAPEDLDQPDASEFPTGDIPQEIEIPNEEVTHSVLPMEELNSFYDKQPECEEDIYEFIGEDYLFYLDELDMPRWENEVDPLWVPSGLIIDQETDSDTKLEYWTIVPLS